MDTPGRVSPISLLGNDVLQELVETAKQAPVGGCFVEVGVYKGGSAFHLAKVAEDQFRKIFLYDTFKGIPYACADDTHKIGDFGDTDSSTVQAEIPYATVVTGVFPGSAVPMPPVSFAHIDCDQYQSVRDAILYLEPRMAFGGIMWFDDYGCLPGATRAVDEIFGDRIIITKTHKALVYIFN